MKNIIELSNIAYRYKDAEEDDFVFKNINYKFEEGKVYSIKGKSGSGKTTLLSLLSGLEKVTMGSVLYEETNIDDIDKDEYRSKNIGIVFQSYNLLPHLTAKENIILSMDISKVKVDNKDKMVLELMEKVGLNKNHQDRRVLRLSGGEQQRVAIARSLSYNPKVIIADEPTGNLDKDTENSIMDIFINLAHKENKCVIIVTHSENICKKSDVVYELKQGKH